MVEAPVIITNSTPCLSSLLQSLTILANAPKNIENIFSLGLVKLSRISVYIAWSSFFCKTRRVKTAEITTICYKLDGEENYQKVPVQWCVHSTICYRDSELWRQEKKVIFHFPSYSGLATLPVYNVLILL